jgi:hypothetical protein
MRAIAATLNIDLLFVPARCTDAMQPCDRYVFGAFRAIYHRLYRCEVVGAAARRNLPACSWRLGLRCQRLPSSRLGRISRHDGGAGRCTWVLASEQALLILYG